MIAELIAELKKRMFNHLEDYVFMKVVVELKTKKNVHCCFSLKNVDVYDHYISVGSL